MIFFRFGKCHSNFSLLMIDQGKQTVRYPNALQLRFYTIPPNFGSLQIVSGIRVTELYLCSSDPCSEQGSRLCVLYRAACIRFLSADPFESIVQFGGNATSMIGNLELKRRTIQRLFLRKARMSGLGGIGNGDGGNVIRS